MGPTFWHWGMRKKKSVMENEKAEQRERMQTIRSQVTKNILIFG